MPPELPPLLLAATESASSDGGFSLAGLGVAATGLIFAHGLELLLIRWVLLSPGRQPQSSVAWILTIAFVPYLGALLYLVFGVDRITRRRRQRVAEVDSLANRDDEVESRVAVDLSQWSERGLRAMRATEALCQTRPTAGNRIEIIHNTHRTMGLIEQAIERAQDHIHLEYYIWQPDEAGRELRDLLIEKAKQGIEVRFLYDSFGSTFLRARFLNPMTKAGIQVQTFLPGQTLREKWAINNRSHRKIVVVDGEVGFTGGMNIGDEYLGRIKKIGRWRDTHMRIEGAAVHQLQQVFREDWFFACGEELDGERYFPPPTRHEPSEIAQIVAGGPERDARPFHQILFTAINEAERSVHLTTGYFIPTDSLAMALASAALRGIEVNILVPGRTPHLIEATIAAGRSYYDKLLAAGCRIHEYTAGTMHAKTLTVDGLWSLVGSCNFDARSTLLNFEVGCVVYGETAAENLVRQFEIDIRDAVEITAEDRAKRRPRHRFAENFCRLFAPIL